MKTAKQWRTNGSGWEHIHPDAIELIQADALRHAASRLRMNSGVELTPQSTRLKWAKEFEREAEELEKR